MAVGTCVAGSKVESVNVCSVSGVAEADPDHDRVIGLTYVETEIASVSVPCEVAINTACYVCVWWAEVWSVCDGECAASVACDDGCGGVCSDGNGSIGTCEWAEGSGGLSLSALSVG